jgi:hypothetical protein
LSCYCFKNLETEREGEKERHYVCRTTMMTNNICILRELGSFVLSMSDVIFKWLHGLDTQESFFDYDLDLMST